MMKNKSEEYKPIMDMDETVKSSEIEPTEASEPKTYKEYRDMVMGWFDEQNYEERLSFKSAWNHMVSEDYDGVDIIINLIDIIYEHCYNNNNNITLADKNNLKQLKIGIQHTISSMKQYNDKDTDKLLVASLTGYLLKVTRNFYHD